jgi:hypothetical protein
VGLKSLKSLNLTNGYPNKNKNKNNNKNNNNKVKSKPLELFELAGKNDTLNRPASESYLQSTLAPASEFAGEDILNHLKKAMVCQF